MNYKAVPSIVEMEIMIGQDFTKHNNCPRSWENQVDSNLIKIDGSQFFKFMVACDLGALFVTNIDGKLRYRDGRFEIEPWVRHLIREKYRTVPAGHPYSDESFHRLRLEWLHFWLHKSPEERLADAPPLIPGASEIMIKPKYGAWAF